MQLNEEQMKAQCFKCKNLIWNECELMCSAFGEENDNIPKDIWNNKFIHNKKHPKQLNDLLFEEGEPAETLESMQ